MQNQFFLKSAAVTVCVIVSLGLAAVSRADDPALPQLKLGEWEVKTYVHNLPNPITVTHCVTEDSRKKLLEMTHEGHGNCGKPEISHSGNTWTGKTLCDYNGKQVTMNMVMTVQSDTSYSSVLSSDSPSYAANVKSEGVYRGECVNKDTQVEVAPGVKFNPKQFKNLAKALAKTEGQ